MGRERLRDVGTFLLMSALLYLLHRYTSNFGLFSQWLQNDPLTVLLPFILGPGLYGLLAGWMGWAKLGRLCLGSAAAALALLPLTALLMDAGAALRDVSSFFGVTWSYALAFALAAWLYGELFGWALAAALGGKAAWSRGRPALWRLGWFFCCLGAAVLYQKSIEFFPHTRLMDFQAQTALLLYVFVPFAGIFLECLSFRARRQA